MTINSELLFGLKCIVVGPPCKTSSVVRAKDFQYLCSLISDNVLGSGTIRSKN